MVARLDILGAMKIFVDNIIRSHFGNRSGWIARLELSLSLSVICLRDCIILMFHVCEIRFNFSCDTSGTKRSVGGNWLSVSQGIAEDTSELVSGFATVGDDLSESVDYPHEWDSDEYDDDDDVGYMRQPIEDEAWFLAHEIDYPSDNEKGTVHGSVPDPQERGMAKDADDQSFAEEDSYFSGERYFPGKNVEPVTGSDDPIGVSVTEVYTRSHDNDLIDNYNGKLMDEEELNLMRAEPVWKGFVTQTNDLILIGDGKVLNDGRSRLDDLCLDEDHHSSVRSIGVGINSDAADIGSEVRESLVGGSSEGDLEYFRDHDGSIQCRHDIEKRHFERMNRDRKKTDKRDKDVYLVGLDKGVCTEVKNYTEGGFSFLPPQRDSQLGQAGSSKSAWSNNCTAITDDNDDCMNELIDSDSMLAKWRRKSSDSSSAKSSREENNAIVLRSADSSPSSLSNYGYSERDLTKKEEDERVGGIRDEDPGASLEDEEAAAVQEQVRQIKAQEEEFETFNLKIVHRKNRYV